MAKRVLIVDDSSTMRKIITRSLRQAGLDCGDILEAGDGAEALELLGREPIDVILSDINMPNMDGMEFLREKAGREALRQIPVVMITTEAGADILAETKALGAVGSIKKPFTPDQIRETLGSWF
jgi:two-component system, chemotaxis family, chemotaxis protein CheY